MQKSKQNTNKGAKPEDNQHFSGEPYYRDMPPSLEMARPPTNQEAHNNQFTGRVFLNTPMSYPHTHVYNMSTTYRPPAPIQTVVHRFKPPPPRPNIRPTIPPQILSIPTDEDTTQQRLSPIKEIPTQDSS